MGPGERVKPRLSQALTRGARPDSNLRPAVQISSPLPSRYAPWGRFFLNTPPQVGEWMSRTPNLRIMVQKLSFPNGLVKTSASCSAEVTNSVVIEPSCILSRMK